MKQITVKIPDKLEKAFNDLVRIEFDGNVNQAVVAILADRLGQRDGGVVEQLQSHDKSIEKMLRWFRNQGIEL